MSGEFTLSLARNSSSQADTSRSLLGNLPLVRYCFFINDLVSLHYFIAYTLDY